MQFSDTITLMGNSETSAVLDATREDRDLLLVRQFLAGEKRAFDELVSRHQQYVYNVCLRMLDNTADAEDVAQDVFVAVYKGLRAFRMGSRVSTWIYRIAMNRCISHRRSRRVELPMEQEYGIRSADIEQFADRRVVRQTLQELAPHYRAVLVLRYYRELSHEEIGEVLGWSSEKVKCYLHRARNHFKRLYEAENGGES
jgi:RNA polymerase sigma-70 factor (ECF subfamily)